jgi:NitT/TauT family transport system substrate-binding protein
MTRWLLVVLSAVALIINVPAAPANADPTKLTIGHGFTSDVVSIYVAKNEGMFAKHGIDATLTPIANPQNLLTGLFAGNLQIIMSNTVQFLTAINGGLDFVVIAGGNRMNPSNDPIGLVLRPDAKYASPADLKGLTIAVPGFNSGTFMLLKEWLATKHVPADQINFVESSMPSEGDLIKGHKVDGVLTAEPFRTQIVGSGTGKLVAKFYTEVIPDQPATFWVATRAWAQANPQLVAAFRASLADASAWIPTHLDETKTIEQQAFGTSEGQMPMFNPTVTSKDLAAIYTIGKQLGMFTKPIDVNTLIVR